MANIGTTEGRIRIAVVDDDELNYQRLGDIFRSGKDFTLTGRFSSAGEALAAMPHLRPDLALVNLSLPDMGGVECVKEIRRLIPYLRVIILSENRDTQSFRRSLDAGAIFYLIKPADADQLIATLHFAAINGNEKGRLSSSRNNGSGSNTVARSLSLSPREKDVLSGLADGLLYKEISSKLGVSFAAVHKYSGKIYRKLGVANRSEAIRIWLDRSGH